MKDPSKYWCIDTVQAAEQTGADQESRKNKERQQGGKNCTVPQGKPERASGSDHCRMGKQKDKKAKGSKDEKYLFQRTTI